MFEFLRHREIVAIEAVVIEMGGESGRLDYTAVLTLGDGPKVQILVDDPRKELRVVDDIDALELWGDYSARTKLAFAPWGPAVSELLPLRVDEIETATTGGYAVRWFGPDGGSGSRYIVGAVLKDARSGKSLAIRTNVDELAFESEPSFREYAARAVGDGLAWASTAPE